MELHTLTRPDLIFAELRGRDRDAVLRELADRLMERWVVEDADALYEKLLEREELASTGIGEGVAIPHCKLKQLDTVVAAVATHKAGVDFEAVDEQPVHLFFAVLSPEKEPAAHLQALSAISKWVKTENCVERIVEAVDPKQIYDMLQQEADD